MPKSKGRKKIKQQRAQTVVEPKTVMRKDFKGETRPVPNPIAGKTKTIYHHDVYKENK